MKALHDIAFPTNPVNVVGGSAGHGVEKKRMAEELNVDGHGLTPRFDGFFQPHAQLPGRIEAEGVKLKLFFLKRQQRQIGIDG